MGVLPPITVLVIAVGFPLVIASRVMYGLQRQKKRVAALNAARERLAEKVRRRGWSVIADPMPPPQLGFSEFKKKGKGQEVRFYVSWPGSEDAAFEHRYAAPRGGSPTRGADEVTHSCVLLRLPFTARRLKIDTGQSLVTHNIVEIESEPFNRTYRVTCRDERFAVTVLDYAFVDAMLQPGVVDHIISLELVGSWMLITVPWRPCEQLVYLLEAGQGLRDRLPAVLPSIYPPRPATGSHSFPHRDTPSTRAQL